LSGDPADIWRTWCSGPLVRAVVDSGHHMAEENPEQVAAIVRAFLTANLPFTA